MNRAAVVWYGIACLLAGAVLADVTRPDAFPDRACETDEECERACGPDDDRAEPEPVLLRVRT